MALDHNGNVTSSKTQNRFHADAKQMVDMLFDKRILSENMTRDDMNALQDLIEFLLESKFD